MIESNHYTQEFYAGQQAGSHSSAMKILPMVQDVFHPRSVIDVGCGVGYWLSVWLNELGVNDIQGVEGPYVSADMLKIPGKFVHFQDLKEPLQINRRFDLAMSLEVAEHLPVSEAHRFVQTLTGLSDVILFSAAIPGQEGTYHINEQMPEFWASLFIAEGYVPVDYIRPAVWGNPQVEWWYQQNVLIYIRKERLAEYPVLAKAYECTSPQYLFRVHPWLHHYHWGHKQKTSTWIGYTRWKLYPLKKYVRGLLNKK